MSAIPSSFPPDIQRFLDDQIAQGKYGSEADVICAAVRLMQDRELRLASLRHDIDRGIAQLDCGDYTDLESEGAVRAFFEDIESQAQQRLSTPQG